MKNLISRVISRPFKEEQGTDIGQSTRTIITKNILESRRITQLILRMDKGEDVGGN